MSDDIRKTNGEYDPPFEVNKNPTKEQIKIAEMLEQKYRKNGKTDLIIRVKFLGAISTPALIPNKVYDVISVEKGWLRIMTELDEDYLFPSELFEIV